MAGRQKHTIRTLITVLILAFAAVAGIHTQAAGTSDDYYYLPVFETSDIHGYLADNSGEKPQYLLAYISDKVKDVRGYGADEDRKKAILLDGGDIFQGNLMSNMLEGQSMSAAYQIMGYDAVTIGNHEFDWGLETVIDSDRTLQDYNLEAYTGVNDIPVVCSNLYKDGEPVTCTYPYIILEKTATNAGGDSRPVRIGVIGFAGDYGSSIKTSMFGGAGYSIDTDYSKVNALAARLEEDMGCNATIVLTHEEAPFIANNLGDNSVIDLVLGGHSHLSLNGISSGNIQYLEPEGQGKAYTYSQLAFAVEEDGLSFRKVTDAKIVPTTSDIEKVTDKENYPDELDPELVALADEVNRLIAHLLDNKIGYITEPSLRYRYLPESGDRACTCGNWMSSILARMVGADVGFFNAGGLRLDFPVGQGGRRDITAGDVYNMFPFNNTTYLYEITYEDMLTVLQYAMTNQGRNSTLSYMTGIECYYTGETVHAILTPDGREIYVNGKWKDGWKDKKVRVAISEYVATYSHTNGEMMNPFVAWNDTSRLISNTKTDIDGALEVLMAEAQANEGHLTIDTRAYFLNKEYTEKEEDNQEEIPSENKQPENTTPDQNKTPAKKASVKKTPLLAKAAAVGKSRIKIQWTPIKNADRYLVYGAACNRKGIKKKLKIIKKIKAGQGKGLRSFTQKGLKKGRTYKYRVVAQKKLKGSYHVIGKSLCIHVITGNKDKKYTNPKSLKLKQTAIKLKVGKKKKIQAKVTGISRKKRILAHTSALRFISADPAVAKISAKGVVTGKKAGKTVIYVQAVNGIWKKVTVRVGK